MAILEATFTPEWAAVTLLVDGGQWSFPVTHVTITRSVPGMPDAVVRGIDRTIAVGGYLAASDIEMPLEVTVSYTVTGYDSTGELVETETVQVSTSGAEWGLWVKIPGEPNSTTLVDLAGVTDRVSATQGGVYRPAGTGTSIAQGIASVSGLAPDAFSIDIEVWNPVLAARLVSALSHRVVLLQTSAPEPFPSAYYFVEQVSWKLLNPSNLNEGIAAAIALERCAMPAGTSTQVAGWSWQSVIDTYPTWDDVLAAADTWFDLVQGP